jgi:hypothetical protein
MLWKECGKAKKYYTSSNLHSAQPHGIEFSAASFRDDLALGNKKNALAEARAFEASDYLIRKVRV